MIVRWISEVPPAMLAALLHSHCRCQRPSPGFLAAPFHSGAAPPKSSSATSPMRWVAVVQASLTTLDSAPGWPP
jgi:hypothetical protein